MLVHFFDLMRKLLGLYEDLRAVQGPNLPELAPGVLLIVLLCSNFVRELFAAEETSQAFQASAYWRLNS